MRQRVVAYVTRRRDGRKELLVFDQREDPGALTQVPAGRLDPGESLEGGLRRELLEEAGLGELRIVRELESEAVGHGRAYENRLFELEVPDDVPDAWEHVVTGDGDDAGLVFVYRWVPLSDAVLWGRREPALEELAE
jgi:8-oxo-dGTP pyrophosphatase MutT (NUDIX family)